MYTSLVQQSNRQIRRVSDVHLISNVELNSKQETIVVASKCITIIYSRITNKDIPCSLSSSSSRYREHPTYLREWLS
jgi:hypothetical protein